MTSTPSHDGTAAKNDCSGTTVVAATSEHHGAGPARAGTVRAGSGPTRPPPPPPSRALDQARPAVDTGWLAPANPHTPGMLARTSRACDPEVGSGRPIAGGRGGRTGVLRGRAGRRRLVRRAHRRAAAGVTGHCQAFTRSLKIVFPGHLLHSEVWGFDGVVGIKGGRGGGKAGGAIQLPAITECRRWSSGFGWTLARAVVGFGRRGRGAGMARAYVNNGRGG
eukprot:gene23350-biopygen7283